jgi:hypothetical protein
MATAPAPPAPVQTVDLAKLSATYIKIREAKLERKHIWEAEEAKFDADLARIEGFMLAHLNTHGMESVRTDGGTFYKQESIKPNIVDDSAFFAWVKENDAFDAMERRVKVGFVKEFAETHEGGLPPGLNVSREWVVRVRRPQS